MVIVKVPVLPFIVPDTCIGPFPWWLAKPTVPVNVVPVCVNCHVMFPIEPPGIPMPMEPVDMPIVAPLESTAVPTQVPVTAAEVPVPVGLLGVVAPAGIDELPSHPAVTTARARNSETCHPRMGASLFELGR
jgi:hypothetical protein